ncbi:MAG: NAD(P)/FAD-dependent oxidoreductase, partial [Bacilli bacterium]
TSMLINLFPENEKDVKEIEKLIGKVIGYMDVLYGIDNPLFLENMKDREYLCKTLLPWFFKYIINIQKVNHLNEPINTYLKRITNNQSLIDMITQHFFENTPTFFAMSYFGVYLDYVYPKGGTGVLAKKLTEYILSSGGDILYDTEVTEVNVKEQKITANGKKYLFNKLVWAANQKTLYNSLCDHESSKINKKQLLLSQCEGGDSILTVFLGIDIKKEYFQEKCGAHTFYTPLTSGLSALNKCDITTSSIDELYSWVGKYLELTTYEISCPVLRDQSLAPIGKTGLIISTLIDYHLVKHMFDLGEYDLFKKYCIKKIESVMTNYLFGDILEHIEFSICSTPLTVERQTSNFEGAITGWAFTNHKMPAINHFMKIAKSSKTPIKNVFQCGQWTFSPSGLPISILTGKMAADAVHKKTKGFEK